MKYCSHCGAQIDDEAVICIHCGVATPKHQQNVQCQSHPLAIIGFVLSFFAQIAGLICSIIAFRRCKENPNLEGKSLALAGILISAISLGIAAFIFLFYFSFFFAIIDGLIKSSPNINEVAYAITSLIG